jgi:signal transduction histidine kinase
VRAVQLVRLLHSGPLAVEPFDIQYANCLRAYLADPSPEVLRQARGLGAKALEDGLGLQEFVVQHQDALASTLMPDPTPAALARTLREGGRFLVEALAPYDQTDHRHSRILRRLNDSLNRRLEDEARRVARTLHDEAGQLLASVHLSLQELTREASPQTKQRVAAIRKMLDRIESDLRNLCHDIRPTVLDTLGLEPAVDLLSGNLAARTKLGVEVRGSTGGRLPPEIETGLYRVIQEALSNAARHAQANRVVVRFDREPGGIACSIKDDGVGFEGESRVESENGLGIVGMRERVESLGGALEIRSRPAHGTEVRAFVPVEEGA